MRTAQKESIDLISEPDTNQITVQETIEDDEYMDTKQKKDACDDEEGNNYNHSEFCFLYDYDSKPTFIERIFGEPYHVKDKYPSNQITISFVFTLIAVYLVEGCINWLMIAIRYYGAAIHDMGPEEMTSFMTMIMWPWNIKIIYGLTTDGFPLFGYRRKSYMLIFGILAAVSMLIAILYSDNYNVKISFMTINQLSISFCDVIADALTIERTEFKGHTVATRLQALAWSSRSIAVIVGSLVSTTMFEKYGRSPHDWIYVYWAYFAVCCSMPMFGIFVPEKRSKNKKYIKANEEKEVNGGQTSATTDSLSSLSGGHTYSIKEILCITYQTLCRKSIFYPVIFVFILACTPTAEEGIVYFLIYKLGFAQTEIGYLSVAAQVAFLISIGIITFQSRKSNSNFSLRTLFIVWTLIATIVPFVTLILIFRINLKVGIPDFWFLISDRIIIQVSGYMLLMGTLVLTARLCPPGIEGVFMTVLTSIMNIGGTVSYAISGQLLKGLNIECIEDPNDENNLVCNFKMLWILIVIVNATTLIPLIFIRKVPNEEDLQMISAKLEQSQGVSHNNLVLDKTEMIGLYWFCKCNKNKPQQQQQQVIEQDEDKDI